MVFLKKKKNTILKIGSDCTIRLVELGTSHQSCPKKPPETSENRPKPIKSQVKSGIRGKFGFVPVQFLKP